RQTGGIVSAGADRRMKSLSRGEAHGGDHILDAGAARDRGGTAVDHRVPDAPRRVVAWVRGGEKFTAELALQGVEIHRFLCVGVPRATGGRDSTMGGTSTQVDIVTVTFPPSAEPTFGWPRILTGQAVR